MSPLPTSHCHITKSLFISVPIQNKLQGIPRGKITEFEETEQALESDILEMSEFSDEEFYLNNCD